MKIQYASDLHLEFPENRFFLKKNPLQPIGDILVLAGDIVPFYVMDKHNDFFNYIADQFKTTYWIPGNHEYYHFDITQKPNLLNERIRNNVFLVNNSSVIHENTKLIFTTLWSKISTENVWQIEKSMNDFYVIKYNNFRLSSEKYNHLHKESLDFIQKELNSISNMKTVIFTHHCPTYLHYPEEYRGSILNEAFAVELKELIKDSNISYWGYGHHHRNIPNFNIGKTKLITNQLGYVKYNENELFKSDKFILV